MTIYLSAYKSILLTCMTICLCVVQSLGQSGENYQIERSVNSSGGIETGNGQYRITSTLSETIAGKQSIGGQYLVQSGFWQPELSPTAALVSIGGRVMSSSGEAIQNAKVTITSEMGLSITSITNAFGYFRFEGVLSGNTYLFSVRSKGYTFIQASRAVSVLDEVVDLVFISDR